MSKRIIFPRAGVAELQEYEAPVPKSGEVLVRLMVSTISSGTERANLSGEINISIRDQSPVAIFPRAGGYSSAGIVEAVGEGVRKFHPGDRVALSWSTHSEFCCLPEKFVHTLDDELTFEQGALLHISIFPLAAIRKCRVEIGESAIVMGQGILGLIALPLLKAAGAVPVIAADPIPEKREKALACGADYALDPFAPDFSEKVKELTGGGVKTAIEVTGNGKALDTVLDCMARFGRVALLGCTRHSDFTIDYYHKVHGPGITMIGAHTDARPENDSSSGWWTQPDDVKVVMQLIRFGRYDPAKMIDETHSPSEAPEVYAKLLNEPSFPMVQFDWRKL